MVFRDVGDRRVGGGGLAQVQDVLAAYRGISVVGLDVFGSLSPDGVYGWSITAALSGSRPLGSS